MKNTFLFTIFLTLFFSVSARCQTQDSTIYVVLNALTADEISVNEPTIDLLIDSDWEALAYWETKDPKELDYMHEAVGDIYSFKKDYTFEMRMIDQNDPQKFGLEITGNYTLEKNKIELIAKNGKSILCEIRYLDTLYLILEFDGLRIFYTKSQSYFSND